MAVAAVIGAVGAEEYGIYARACGGELLVHDGVDGVEGCHVHYAAP